MFGYHPEVGAGAAGPRFRFAQRSSETMAVGSLKALRQLMTWRSYVLVVVGAYLLALSVNALLAPLRGNLENLVFDQYQRWKPRPYDFSQPVRIVDIDDESIHLIGRWPWSRRKMADLVEALVKANVAGIGFDYLFSEQDSATPIRAPARRPGGGRRSGGAVRRARERRLRARAGHPGPPGRARRLPHPDAQRLAGESHDQGRIFLRRRPAERLRRPFQGRARADPRAQRGGGRPRLPELAPDNDRVVRRVPLLLDVNGQLQPSLALETLRVAQGASGYVVKSTTAYGSTAGKSEVIDSIKDGDVVVPLQADGQLRVWWAKSDPRRSIPAWKVLQPDADLSDLAGKLVLIGASASLLVDIVATPLDPSTPGVEAHAQLLEQILSGVTLERPDWAPGAESLVGAASVAPACGAPAVHSDLCDRGRRFSSRRRASPS